MIRTADVSRVYRLAENGRNKPIMVALVTNDDVEHDAVLKPSLWNELTKKSVIREFISSVLAVLIGVPVCEPFLVPYPRELIQGLGDNEFRDDLSQCEWPGFACKNAGKQWSIWSSGHPMGVENHHSALCILAFDAFIQNPDRCKKNPNLLVKGSEFRAIDHELAFSSLDVLPFLRSPNPWEQGGMQWLTEGLQKNILLSGLRTDLIHDFESIRDAWSSISDAELDGLLNLLPFQEGDIAVFSQSVIAYVKDVRDNIDGCIEELERILS